MIDLISFLPLKGFFPPLGSSRWLILCYPDYKEWYTYLEIRIIGNKAKNYSCGWWCFKKRGGKSESFAWPWRNYRSIDLGWRVICGISCVDLRMHSMTECTVADARICLDALNFSGWKNSLRKMSYDFVFLWGSKGKISRNGAAGTVCHASILGKLSGGTNKHALSVSNILSSWIFRVARLSFSPGGLPNWFSWLDSSFRSYFFNPRAAKTWMHFFSYNHFIAKATGGVPLGNVFIISTIDPGLSFSSCARQKSFLSDRTALPLTPCG